MHAIVVTIALLVSAMPCRAKSYLRSTLGPNGGILADEPSCEDLRLMWRFSRRQSRVPEITNEIPTFRDPFMYNVWEEIPRPRNIAGTLRSGGRSWTRPVYGRIVQHAPSYHPRNNPDYSRAYQEVMRYLGGNTQQQQDADAESRREGSPSSFRLSGPVPRYVNSGGFQNLKNMIWAERAKELQQQRMLEESAARSLATKTAATSAVQQPRYNGVFREKPQPLYAVDYAQLQDYPVYFENNGDRAANGFSDFRYDQRYQPNTRGGNSEMGSWRPW